MILFGSVARDTVTTASDIDIDIMIILDDDMTEVNWRVEDAIIDIAYPLELEDDVVFDLKVMGKHDLQGKFRYMPFIERIMKEGIAV